MKPTLTVAFVLAFAVLSRALVGCSSDEGAPKPVPLEAATDAGSSHTPGEGGKG